MSTRRQLEPTVLTHTSTGGALESLRSLRVPQWADRGLCAGRDPEVWFPKATSGRGGAERMGRQSAEAKAICAECPVRTECLQQALESGERHGVWGGLDEFELRDLRTRSAS